MSSSPEEEFDEFMDSQFAFMDSCNKQLIERAREFHKRACGEQSNLCETHFLGEFLRIFGEEIKRRGEARGIHFTTHRVNLN